MSVYRETDGTLVREYKLTQNTWVRKQTGKALFEMVPTAEFGATLFLNGELQLAFQDEYIYHEMLVHPCMSSSKSRQRICIIGGGDGCALREVLKWPDVKHVDVLDWDKEIVTMFSKQYSVFNSWSFEDSRVHIEHRAIQSYGGELREYDCIVVDLLDPDDSQGELWLTLLSIVKSWIVPGGSIVINAGGITPWQTDTLNWLLQHIESKPNLWRHLYKVFVPSFAREWCFLLLNHAKVVHLNNIPSNVKYIDDTAWHQAYTYGWTKNYLEKVHGI